MIYNYLLFQIKMILKKLSSKYLLNFFRNIFIYLISNLSTIVKRSEELLTPIKQPQITTTVRRAASLHLTKVELDRRKLSNSITKSSKLHDSISDR